MQTWKMVCIGLGPGPKNVLAERYDGFRTVVAYATWKYKLSKEEIDIAVYKTLAGFVQFDVNEREAAGQKIKDFNIVPIGQGDAIPQVRVTLWPEFAHAKVGKGDFVAVQGKFTTNASGGKTYFNLSAGNLLVNGTLVQKSTEEISNPVEEEDEDFDPGF